MSERKSIGSTALEVFSIVFGVLLALGVSEWAEEREKAELAEAALSNVVNEMKANLDILGRIHDNNAQTIATSLEEEDDSTSEEEEQLQFIPGVHVRSTAWSALLSTGASNHLDYSLILALSEMYSRQSIYRETGIKLVESSMSMAAMATVNNTEIDNQHFQAQFGSYFQMLLGMEESLLENYATTLALIENYQSR